MCVVSDAIEVKNAISTYGKEAMIACGGNSTLGLTFQWFKDGEEIHSDSHREILVHKHIDYSELTVKKGNNTIQFVSV